MPPAAPESEKTQTENAIKELTASLTKLTMQWVVLDIAVREAIAILPPEKKRLFIAKFKKSAQTTMHNLADKLMPADDAEISASVRRILDAASASQ